MTNRLIRRFVIFICLTTAVFSLSSFASQCSATDADSGDVPRTRTRPGVFSNLAYSTPQRPHCTGDLYVPAKEAPIPAIVLIHGGGWIRGDKSDADMQALIAKLVADNYAVFNINYRLVKDGGKFPYSIGDVRNALNYLRSIAPSYGIDANNIALMGSSAGGYLALMAGFGADYRLLTSKVSAASQAKPKCVICFSPVTELSKEQGSYVTDFMDDTAAHSPELFKAAEPLTYASCGIPTLVVHGVRDQIVPIENSEELVKGLRQQKCEAKLLSVEDANHQLQPGQQLDAAYQRVHNFLTAHLI